MYILFLDEFVHVLLVACLREIVVLETNLSRIDLESPATILHQGVHYPLKSADVTGHNCWSANNGYSSNGTNGASRPAPPKITVSELTANGMVDVTDLHLNGGQMYSQEFSCSDCQQTNRTLYSPSGQNQGRGNLSCAMANSQHIERRIRTHSSSPIRPSNHGCHPYSRDNSPMRSNQMADCWFEESLHGPVASNQSPNFGSYAQVCLQPVYLPICHLFNSQTPIGCLQLASLVQIQMAWSKVYMNWVWNKRVPLAVRSITTIQNDEYSEMMLPSIERSTLLTR